MNPKWVCPLLKNIHANLPISPVVNYLSTIVFIGKNIHLNSVNHDFRGQKVF